MEVLIQCMMWKFKNNKTATETAKKISSIYDQSFITNRQVRKWFAKFCSNDISSLSDETSARSSPDFDQKALRELMALINGNSHNSTRELTVDLNISQSTICSLLKKMGKLSQRLGV